MNLSFTLLHSKASVATGHVCNRRNFSSAFLHGQEWPSSMAWKILPLCWLPLLFYDQWAQEIYLKS